MNSTDLITQIIVAVAGVVTPAICVYVANLIKKYIPKKSLLQALEQFAKDAVVLAEQTGVKDDYLNKKKFAICKLQEMLESAGFSKQDEDLLSGCIEHAYCELKDEIESVYKDDHNDKVYSLSETTDTNGNIKSELNGGKANEEK